MCCWVMLSFLIIFMKKKGQIEALDSFSPLADVYFQAKSNDSNMRDKRERLFSFFLSLKDFIKVHGLIMSSNIKCLNIT